MIMIKYAVSPGLILKEYMKARNITQKELTEIIGSSEKHISKIITGKAMITEEFALKLEAVFPDVRAEYWMDLSSKYKLDLLRLKEEDESIKSLDLILINKEYQLDLIFKGLNYSPVQKVKEFLNLSGVSSFNELKKIQQGYQNLFFQDGGNPNAQFAWLKLCENEFDIQNDLVQIGQFNKEQVEAHISIIKKIINTTDFKFMINNLRKLLNKLGIGLVLLEALPTSKIRGAITFVNQVPAIFISTRRKTLDSFYFTLFHELYHILKDDLKKTNYSSISYEDDPREMEANDFARKVLIDENSFKSLLEKTEINASDIIKFADEQGVISDIVIGFIEHDLRTKIGNEIYKKYASMRTRINIGGD